jgi:pimeloyl-ACP methyl ester carboxylesterase
VIRILRRLIPVLALLTVLAVAGLAALRWSAVRAPIDAPLRSLQLAQAETFSMDTPGGPRQYTDLLLVREEARERSDTLHATLSLPADWAGERLPVLLLLGGAGAGRQSLRYVEQHGANAILAYEYPYDAERVPHRQWYRGAALAQVPAIRRSVLAVPAQVRDLTAWIGTQTWADAPRTALLGFSFGALFAPSVQQLLQRDGLRPAATVLAYGGADLGRMLRANLGRVPAWSRAPLAWTIETLIRPVEPTRHLAGLEGRFLAINGLHDEQIPAECVQRLHAGLPPHAEIRLLDAGHLHPRRPELTREVAALAREWLLQADIANP